MRDPLSETGAFAFTMWPAERFSIVPGALVTIAEKRLRFAQLGDVTPAFIVPPDARVEGKCITWRQEQPLAPVENSFA